MKQFKNKKQQQPLPSPSFDQNTTKNNNKNKVLSQIDKIQKQIQEANDDIKKTQKMLDVDLFLKQQKQKRLNYAKQINADYQAQKKIREEKLYRKFKRDDREQKEDREGREDREDRGDKGDGNKSNQLGSTGKIEQSIEGKTNDKIQFKFLNIPVLNPITIVKVLLNQRGPDQWVKDGHHYKPDDIKSEGIRQSEQKMFENLYVNPNEKRKYDGDLESKHYAWRNIKQVVENATEMITLPKQIGENSLIPNNFHAQNILGAVILMNDKISKETFAQNSQLFLSQLFLPNGQKTVIVDKFVKIREFPHKYVNLGSRCQDPNIMWPTLIQKSVDKLKICTNMPHLSSSICKSIYTFFGLDPQIVPISNKNVIKQNFHFVLGYLIHEGAVGFMNVNGHSNKSYENRIYPLEEVKQQLKKQGNLQKKQIKYKIKNPWRGKLLHNENVNRFTLLQLLQLFNCIVLLRDYPNKYQCLRIQVNYFSNGSISPTSNEWTKNPQYLFTITKPTNLRIILRKSGQLNQTTQQKESVYGFLLFQNKQASNKIQALKMDWLIVKTKSVDFGEAMYSAEIGRGNYILIPYSTQQSTKEYQFYVLDFIVQRQSNIQFGKARYFDYNYTQKKGKRLNTGQSKIIQSLQSTEIFQKPRIQKIPLPSQFKPQFTQDEIRKLPLNICKQSSIKNFFIPGQISNLLINKSIQIELKQNKDSLLNVNININMQDNQQLKKEENSQNLEILLGYDVLYGDSDINQGMMNQIIQQSVGEYDFRNFGLGQEGIIAVLQALSTHPQIFFIDLSGNDLDDYSITFLCYSLQKGNRTELRQLNVQRNKFGKIGRNALKGLKGTFPKLQIKGSQ